MFRPPTAPPAFGLFAPVAVMYGAGQAARADARASVDVTEGQQRCLDALTDVGRTRTEIAEATGMKTNTVNGRISELRALHLVVTQGRRGTESVCWLKDQVPTDV